MRRLPWRIFPVLLLLAVVTGPGARAHDGHSHTIKGRFEPELLPETSVWEHVFYAIHSLTGGRMDPRDPEVHSFVAGNLFLSDADAAVLLEEVAAVQARIQRLERQQQEALKAGDRALEEATLREQIEQAPLEARDKTLKRLSPRGSKALLRWVAVIKQGMSHGPNR
jgi:hypothetical protein